VPESLTQIGKYHIERELGRGGMGVVYRAFDPVVERTVAIKTIRLDVENPGELVDRLKREAKSVGQLEHANIVTLYDAGESSGMFYLAMQFIQGETLQDRINRQKWFTWKETHELMRQIAAGLGYAHDHGVVHRDIKPANIMITPEGVVKLTDFGIAKLADTGVSSSGLIVGTPSYMSPEQALGRPVDARSDIFSLGSILYELTTAEKAFPGQNATTIIYKIVHESPVPVTSLQPGLDPALDAIVIKTLAKSPDARFHSCKEFAQALDDYTEQLVASVPKTSVISVAAPKGKIAVSPAVSTAPEAPVATMGRPSGAAPSPPKGNLLWLGMGALAAVLVVGLFIAYTRFGRQAPEPKSVVPPTTSETPASQPPTDQQSTTTAQPVENKPTAEEATKPAVVQREPTRRQTPTTVTRPPVTQSSATTSQPAAPPPSSQPETFDSLVVKGDLAFQKGNYQAALDSYSRANAMKPSDKAVSRKVGMVLMLLGRPEEARKYQ
jgi:eukaryotic-like serine/threonine-protein kinase